MNYVPYNFESTSSTNTTFVGPPPVSISVSVPPATTEFYCESLIETYNASIIEKFPDFLKDSFLRTAKDCLEKKRRIVQYKKTRFRPPTIKSFYEYRTVLKTLITNLENQKITPTLPDVGFIEGPMNMTLHWSKKYKKLIYILGERHIGHEKCPIEEIKNTSKIEDYLDKIFKKPIAFIDFYLEIGGFVISDGYPSKYEGQESLDLLRDKFKDCIDTLTRNRITTGCKTSRMHFFDIRQGDIKFGIPLMTQFGNVLFDVRDNFDYGIQDSNYQKLIQTFLDFFKYWDWLVKKIANFDTQEEYEKFWYDQIYNFQIIRKEIDLMHSDVRPYLNWFIQTKLTEYINYNVVKKVARNIMTIYYKYLLDHKKITFERIMLFYDEINKFSNICTININSLLTDAYLLARVFKTFKINDPKKQRLTDEPEEPHNIIIYAGNNHAIRCREFLTHIGFKTLEKSGEGFYKNDKIINDKCIDIKKENGLETPTITQPLFNNWPYEIEDNKMTHIDSEELKIYERFDDTFNYFIKKEKDDKMQYSLSDDKLKEIGDAYEMQYNSLSDDELKEIGDAYEMKYNYLSDDELKKIGDAHEMQYNYLSDDYFKMKYISLSDDELKEIGDAHEMQYNSLSKLKNAHEEGFAAFMDEHKKKRHDGEKEFMNKPKKMKGKENQFM